MFADVATLAVSYLSARLSSREPSSWMNYGYARAEALGALLAIAFIYSIAAYVALNAAIQIANQDFEILSVGMMYAGGCAVVFNIFLFFFLRGIGVGHAHSHGGGGGGHGHSHNGGSGDRESNIAHRRFENQDDDGEQEKGIDSSILPSFQSMRDEML